MMRRVCSMTSPSGENRQMRVKKLTTRSTYVQLKFRSITEGLDGECGDENSVEGYRIAVHIGKNVQKPNRYIVTLLQSITASRFDSFACNGKPCS